MIRRVLLLAGVFWLAFASASACASTATVSGFTQTQPFAATATVTLTHSGCADEFGFCSSWYSAAYHLPASLSCAADTDWISWFFAPLDSGSATPQSATQSASLILQAFGHTHLCVYVSDFQRRELVADVPLSVVAPDPSVDHDCPGFPNQWSAQDFLEEYGDVSGLDADNDQIACEFNGAPRRGPSPHPWPIEQRPPARPAPQTPPIQAPAQIPDSTYQPPQAPPPAGRRPTPHIDAIDARRGTRAALASRAQWRAQKRAGESLVCRRRSASQFVCIVAWRTRPRAAATVRTTYRGRVVVTYLAGSAGGLVSWTYRVRQTQPCARKPRRVCSKWLTGRSNRGSYERAPVEPVAH